MKDTLYLLKPGFLDGEVRFFCSHCAMVEGMLSFYPALRERVEVRYLAYRRPRPEMITELGEAHQGLPCIVVRDEKRAAAAPPSVHFEEAQGKRFITEPVEICEYLAAVHGADRPH